MDPGPDLERWELAESASTQNAVVSLGPIALVVVPLTALLTAAIRMVRRRSRP